MLQNRLEHKEQKLIETRNSAINIKEFQKAIDKISEKIVGIGKKKTP